jgi:serine/threonine-protein kinase
MIETIPEPALQVGDVLDGRYRLVAVIGEGAYGMVYRAEHTYTRRVVAVKVLREELLSAEDTVKRFIREASLASQIDHPNCIRVYEFAKTPAGQFYLVTELLEGEPLSNRLSRVGRLTLREMLFFMKQLLAALSAVHQRGMVHRDVKPENIMLVVGETGEEKVKLLDFGFAKRPPNARGSEEEDNDSVTAQGFTLGTPAYIAPEQAANRALDARTDLYAAGVVLYRMLVGKPPFEQQNPLDTVLDHVHKAPPPPSLVAPEAQIPPSVEGVILRSLAKDPAQRYQNADDFLQALNAAVNQAANKSAVLKAMLDRGVTEGENWLFRYRWVVAVMAVLALSLTSAAVYKVLSSKEEPAPPVGLITRPASEPQIVPLSAPTQAPAPDTVTENQPAPNAPPLEEVATEPATIQASELLGAGKPEEALEILRTHLRENPEDIEALRFLLSVSAQLDLWDDASEALKLLRSLDPSQSVPRAALDAASKRFADGGKKGKGATQFLTKSAPKEGGPLLAERVDASNSRVREAAISALGQMNHSNDYNAAKALSKALSAEKDCKQKKPIVEALGNFVGDSTAIAALEAEAKETGLFGKSRCLVKVIPPLLKKVNKSAKKGSK